jgi:3-dehydroquinate synthase
MTTHLHVKTATASYDFVIGSGLFSEAGHRLPELGVQKDAHIFIVTDDTVNQLGYAEQIRQAVREAGYDCTLASVPPGDGSKSLEMAEELYLEMLDAGVRRSGVVIAVGGGVVGDLAGFVAATYQRGVRFIQAPTTLLAHDSSIGGKVGVNLKRGKNLVGAFHQPLAVWMDVDALKSLPKREWRGGMAEVIKHGMIGDKALFERLEKSPALDVPDSSQVETLIARAASVKIRIVEQDERESNLRMVLNLGHTVGHAVEQVSHYELNHGEAVAIGIRVETEIAHEKRLVTAEERRRIIRILERHGLPVKPPAFSLESIIETLNYDKKHTGKSWTFVLPNAIGGVKIVHDVTYEDVKRAWEIAQKET